MTRACAFPVLFLTLALAAGDGRALFAAESSPAGAAALAQESEEMFRLGRLLFEQLAPAEVKAQYDFPTKERWDTFVAKFQRAMAGNSLEELASLAADGRSALSALRLVPGYQDLADWLEQRIDEIEGADQIVKRKPPPPKPPGPPVPIPPSE